jgi:hypothetical protein
MIPMENGCWLRFATAISHVLVRKQPCTWRGNVCQNAQIKGVSTQDVGAVEPPLSSNSNDGVRSSDWTLIGHDALPFYRLIFPFCPAQTPSPFSPYDSSQVKPRLMQVFADALSIHLHSLQLVLQICHDDLTAHVSPPSGVRHIRQRPDCSTVSLVSGSYVISNLLDSARVWPSNMRCAFQIHRSDLGNRLDRLASLSATKPVVWACRLLRAQGERPFAEIFGTRQLASKTMVMNISNSTHFGRHRWHN